jgi:hypothetical protein
VPYKRGRTAKPSTRTTPSTERHPELTASHTSYEDLASSRRQHLIRHRDSSRGCRIESSVFVEEATALRAQRDHNHGR